MMFLSDLTKVIRALRLYLLTINLAWIVRIILNAPVYIVRKGVIIKTISSLDYMVGLFL